MAFWNGSGSDDQKIQPVYPGTPPGYEAPIGGGSDKYFFSDPVQRYYESAIRKRIGEVQDPLQSPLPGMGDFRDLMGQFGGNINRITGGGSGNAPPSRLDPFKAFADSFKSTIGDDFNQYVQSRDPSQGTQGLRDYTSGRNPTEAADALKNALANMGPNTSIDDLRNYFAGRDTSAPTDTLKDFLAKNEGMLGGYEANMADRIAQLRGNPFDDTFLQARRVASFEDMEREREVEKQRLGETMAARGIMPGSGLYDRAQREIDQRYDERRAQGQNQLVQEEFALRESHQQQADALENQGATFRLQSAELAGGLTSQIAQLQMQGISMNDALQQSIATLGLQDRKQEQDMLAQVAQLTNQGYQMQDALQIALTQAGLESQRQADAMRQAGAELGLKEQQQGIDLQGLLAQLGVTERGQDTDLQAAAMNAAMQGELGQMGNLLDYFRLGQNQQVFDEGRRDQSVTLAALLDAMARQSLLDQQGALPQLK